MRTLAYIFTVQYAVLICREGFFVSGADLGRYNVVPAYPVNKDGAHSFNQHSSEIVYEHSTDDDFRLRSSRLAFIRKVYAIFIAQMTCTIVSTGAIMSNHDLAFSLMRNYAPITCTSAILSSGLLCALVASPHLRHRYPINLVLLGLYTIMQSILVGAFSCFFDPKMVCYGTVHTLAAFLAITLYSFQPEPKFDLTAKSGTLLTVATTVFVGGVLGIFFRMPLFDNVLSAILAILCVTFTMYDTQKIVGGKHHKYSYGKNEYILAALHLYQDIINLFMHIMLILERSNARKNREETF